MISWANDDELFEIMKTELYTAVVGDILDTMHYYHQFLPQKIQPMSENMIVAGRAMPVAECDIDNLTDEMKNSPLFNQPFGLMLDALDDLKKNEVYICSGASPDYALVGEIMCTRMKHLGWSGSKRLSQRYKGHFGYSFSLLFLRQIFSGPSAQR